MIGLSGRPAELGNCSIVESHFEIPDFGKHWGSKWLLPPALFCTDGQRKTCSFLGKSDACALPAPRCAKANDNEVLTAIA
jgi:hypothetical protein